MEAAKHGGINVAKAIGDSYSKLLQNNSYRYFALVLGAPVNLFTLLVHRARKTGDAHTSVLKETREELVASGLQEKLESEFTDQLHSKARFFGQQASEAELAGEAKKLAAERFELIVAERADDRLQEKGLSRSTFISTFQALLQHPLFLPLSFIPGLPLYLLIFLYSSPYLKYIFERLIMTVFVIFGVAVLVFTILYISPFDPAVNILGQTATDAQIMEFNRVYGLDQSYLVQLWHNIKGIAMFDLGKAFAGNEEIVSAIGRKFPVTLELTLFSLLMAVVIAIPIGIISAARPNSWFDYTFMLIALIGLSIPSFWQGLIFILGFSIKLQWLPATFNPGNWLTFIMPVVVLGTGLTAAIARMTRASTLEVIHEDYIITATAKGLSRRKVLLKHAVRNALIPIVTVIGLQFGAMLGGAAVTEKVFNISGLGSYIVDKQFIPDIPAIMGGVVYTAITISLINAMIDILYAFVDPRIRSKMKQY
ncbi:peptide ABC transporter permease [Paenibacillus sp. FSL R7-0273]|uniref:ABC transporter permease n=1 Tax=Paenibacillus sp. FSL R7-0273 TaxID=1536772 RepID=UPI0004F7E5DE|nr:ABC transporter permease [Paenibacillus sp. FSL R7-0273]AIQ45847.1 peptide ABC transporter permease [Paenibacillus sp. FSL R7-0273]OMF95379.1 peptide ABC transporter permease [Paenibacillus sp. FSL R7-0273]